MPRRTNDQNSTIAMDASSGIRTDNGDLNDANEVADGPPLQQIAENTHGDAEYDAWDVTEPEPAEALIDLGHTWDELMRAQDADAANVLADSIANELAFYIHAPRSGGALGRMSNQTFPGPQDVTRAGTEREQSECLGEDISVQDQRSAPEKFGEPDDVNKHSSSGTQGQSDVPDKDPSITSEACSKQVPATSSVSPEFATNFGEDLLLALACEDKRPQKAVPPMTYDAITSVMSENAARVSSACNTAPHDFISRAVASSVTMTLLPSVLFTLIEAEERKKESLATACRTLLLSVARVANPREFHVMLKSALSRISSMYQRDIYGLIVEDILKMWNEVVPRIRGKRFLFLRDVGDVLDMVVFDKQRDLPDSLEKEVLVSRLLNSIACDQLDDMKSAIRVDENRMLDVYTRMREPEQVCVEVEHPEMPAVKGEEPKSAKNIYKKGLAGARNKINDKENTRHDSYNERITTLALTLKLYEHVVDKLPLPVSEPRTVSKVRGPEKRRKRKLTAAVSGLLSYLKSLTQTLGLDNPVDACQQFSQLLSIDVFSDELALLRDTAHAAPARKRKSESFFSTRSAACYLIAALCLHRDEDVCGCVDRIDDSVFATLEPAYAFQLVLPYFMTAVGDLNPVVSLYGTELLAGFLNTIPENSVDTLQESVALSYKSSFMQSESSWFGLIRLLAKATGQFDDPKCRAFAYETMQSALRKLKAPEARYSVLTVALLQAEKAAMSAQLITELKDAIRAIDVECAGEISERYRTRFAETCLPRYCLPRKEFLAGLDPVVAVSSAGLFLALSDSKKENGSDDVRAVSFRRQRMKFCETYLKVAKEAIRAVAAVSEHDRRTIPDSKLAKSNHDEARTLYSAAARTLNDCVAAISSIDYALSKLSDALAS